MVQSNARGLRNDAGNDAFYSAPPSFSREVIILFTICSAQAMVQAVLAQGIIPANSIAKTFGSQEVDLPWYPAAYALTSGTFMLPAGRLGDLVGHKRLLVWAWAWFALWSLLAGVSVYSLSQIFFCICRAMQGIAVTALVPSSLAMLGIIYKPGPKKNLAFSLFAAGAPVGFTLGGVFSALFSQLASWPWGFYATAIACSLYCVGGWLFIPEPQKRSDEEYEKPSFDYLGTLTGTSGLILVNFAWNRAPSVGWGHPECIVTLIVGVICLATFFIVESRYAREPIVPVSRISNDVGWVLLIEGFGWSSFGIFIYYTIMFTLNLRHETLLSTASQLIPVPFAGISASILTSTLLSRNIASPPVILVTALIWFLVINIFLATMPVDRTYWLSVFWAYVVGPFGMDMSFPAGTIILSNSMSVEDQGIAASLIATIVYYSQSIGLGIAGTVEAKVARGDVLRGYRGASYLGIGLSGIGLLIASIYAVLHNQAIKRNAKQDEKDRVLE